MKGVSKRRLSLTYVGSLSVIAMLAFASEFMLEGALHGQQDFAAIINQSGRQRMLSQRIASFAGQYALGDLAARSRLLVATNAFEAGNAGLVRGVGTPGSRPNDPELSRIYDAGPHPLSAQVRDYVALARRIAAKRPAELPHSSELASLFAAARAPLLSDLEATVSVHEAESDRHISVLERLQTVMLGVVLATLAFEAFCIFNPMVRRVARYAAELTTLATTDELTGVLNRRSLLDRGNIEVRRAIRYRHSLAVLMIDCDHFKTVNDTYGHQGGDAVLIELAKTLRSELRATDLLGRVGGDEFVIVLTETDAAGAEVIANRMRAKIGDAHIPTDKGVAHLTISIGVAAVNDPNPPDLTNALKDADEALYRTKSSGRNRVVVASGSA